MSRSGYIDDGDDQWQLICWRGAVHSAMTGRRGQTFLKELLAALDAMPVKRLIAEELQAADGNVCALGAIGKARNIDMTDIDPEESEKVAATFGIAPAMAREIVYMNDEYSYWLPERETPESRWLRIRAWVDRQIIRPDEAAS